MSEPELGRLFHDLAVAWRALSAYPPGHPTAAEALDRAHASLAAATATAGGLELGAGRDGLLRGAQRFDGATAQKMADLLRRRRAAAVSFSPACTASELETFLRALFADPRRARAAIGFGSSPGWPSARSAARLLHASAEPESHPRWYAVRSAFGVAPFASQPRPQRSPPWILQASSSGSSAPERAGTAAATIAQSSSASSERGASLHAASK
jgi:hypothetical protein